MKEVKTPIVQLISFVVIEHPVELQKMFHANNEWKIDKNLQNMARQN